jgi:D-threo-aldose 1-dehydrogenase
MGSQPAGSGVALDKVPLGRAGVEVSRMGFGGAPIGGLFRAVDDDAARRALAAAWDCGIRYFDTAPHYGAGRSEQRVGEFLRARPRDQWAVSTKVGRLIEAARPGAAEDFGFVDEQPTTRVFDFSESGVRRSLETSLERLGVERVDVALLHDPDEHLDDAIAHAWPALTKLREEGVVRSVGAGMNQTPALTRLVQETDIDVVLLAGRYTLLDQGALDDLFPACSRRATSVVVGGVFNSGILADPFNQTLFDYQPASPRIRARALRIAQVCADHGVPIAAAALQFPLAHPAVTSIVVGARSPAEARENCELLNTPIPSELWTRWRAASLLRPDAPVPGDRD